MRLGVTAVTVGLLASAAVGQERFVERAPLPKQPPAHTMSRSGNSAAVAWWAVPGVGRHEGGGRVNGDGTFGWDFVGFGRRAGRVFRGASEDPSAGRPAADGYRSDGPHVPDVFNLRPVRRAVLEKREAAAEGKGGR